MKIDLVVRYFGMFFPFVLDLINKIDHLNELTFSVLLGFIMRVVSNLSGLKDLDIGLLLLLWLLMDVVI